MADADPRIYNRSEVIAFRKTNEPFGGLSNMAPGFPIKLLGERVRTSEALYQACRFPHLPHVQRLIIDEISPMTAKMRGKPYREQSRSDWDAVRIPIMKWCLRVKLAQNWSKFGDLLLETGDRPIVEDSRKDDFWGAKVDEDGVLRGRNVLGRLLMELRGKLLTEPGSLETVPPVPLLDFTLFSREIPTIVRPTPKAAPSPDVVPVSPSQLDMLAPGIDAVDASAEPRPTLADAGVTPAMDADAASAAHDVEGIPWRKVGWLAVGAVLLAVLFLAATTGM